MKRKNILEFHGKPIIAYSIEAAFETGIFDRVVVSTEDNEIAEVAKRFGAEIEGRTLNLTTDESGVKDVCLDLLKREQAVGREYDILCTLYATAPLRYADDIRKTYRMVDSGDCDFALAITEYPLPPHQALKVDGNGMIVPMWPELVNKQSNEIPDLYVDNGSTYVVRVSEFVREKSFYGPRLKGYPMPRERSVDIDTIDDFQLAEIYAERIKR